jgi:hypothetical protein
MDPIDQPDSPATSASVVPASPLLAIARQAASASSRRRAG